MRKRILSMFVVLCIVAFSNLVNVKAGTQADVTAKIAEIKKTYPVGSYYYDNFDGTECKGFANYVFFQIFSIKLDPYIEETPWKLTNRNTFLVGELKNSQITGENVKKLMKQARPGDAIQTQYYKSSGTLSQHSMTVEFVSDGGIHVYEGNYGGYCRVNERYISYEEFAYTYNVGVTLNRSINYDYWFGDNAITITPPNRPTVTNVTTDCSQVIVSWNSVENATEYRCEIVKAETGFPLASNPIQTTNTSCIFSLPEGSYYAYVMALNASGRSEASEWYLFGVSNTKPVAPIVMGADPTYYFKGDTITLSWSSVSNADKYSYYLAQHPTGYAYNTPVQSGVTTNTSVSFYNLPVGKYVFFVHADNAYGSSPQSNWVGIVVNDMDYVPVATEIYDNHIYALYDNWTSWSYAKELCEKMGGHLVTITSKEENCFIKSFIDKGQCSGYWIGLTDENKAVNDFQWITEELLEFSDWAAGDPNNWGEYGNQEDYVQIHKSYSYNWIDTANCSNTSVGFVLEIALEDVLSTAEQIHNGSKYILFDHNMTWTEASKYCESIGGHLVTIDSEKEYEFMTQFLELGKRSWYLLGGLKKDGSFKWIDDNGSVATYGATSHWLDGCPTSNVYSNYMMMYKNSKKWYELKNFYEFSDHMKHLGFVCEIENSCTNTNVTKKNTTYIVETKLYNFVDPCNILVAGYKEEKLVTLKSEPVSQDNISLTLEGDIDEIKVMAWEGIDNIRPLCEAEEIPSSKWITE